ncbi:MAG TPA: LD-carboxypeptidase [Allosphingosinicella sp.]|jgi:muramoyltetrapeptide carboxypeptidase|nr:LD-carboxypeptidase [Allosphingosinicella sp.]
MITRRRALQSIAGAAVLSATTTAFAQPQPRKPPRLKVGDTVGLVEPSWSSGDRFDIALAAETVRAMGLVPKIGRHVGERYGFLAGRDEQRAADLNAMYADPSVRAIFALRGGSGAARILPMLDWRTIRANPKLLIGYSDITALHMAIAARAGTPTLHAPMLTVGSAWGKLSWNAFRALAFEGATPTYVNPLGNEDRLVQRSGRIRTFRPGKASGRLLGGNLTVLTALVGTPYLPDFDGAILFLEDVDEGPYRVDRMMTQLALSGILGRVAGVVFGQCTGCNQGGSLLGGFTVSEVLEHHLTPLRIPAFEGALLGHIPDQWSFPIGIRAEIDASAGTIRMLEPTVA